MADDCPVAPAVGLASGGAWRSRAARPNRPAGARPLAPSIAAIVDDGIEAGQFRPQDHHAAATYVLASFGSLHEVVSDPADLPQAIQELNAFVFRGLGYEGELPG